MVHSPLCLDVPAGGGEVTTDQQCVPQLDTYMHTRTRTCTHIHTHTHTYIHTHKYTHTHTHRVHECTQHTHTQYTHSITQSVVMALHMTGMQNQIIVTHHHRLPQACGGGLLLVTICHAFLLLLNDSGLLS